METIRKIEKIALIVGIIGLLFAGFGLIQGLMKNESRLVVSWLIGFSIWYSLAIGMLFLVMIWHVFDAGWATIVRRQVEHGLSIFPWLGLIFIPLVLIGWFYKENPGIVWSWMNPELLTPDHGIKIGDDPIYLDKAGLLNVPFFTIRVIFYFVFFTFLANRLRYYSFSLDYDPDPAKVKKMKFFSGLGIPTVALVGTLSVIDFYMSISYQWFSTMYGVWFFATSMRAALAVTVIICAILGARGYLKGIVNRGHYYDLGSLAFTFTVFWAYAVFCQYFLIYHANVPEETFWFNMRELTASGTKSSWWWFSIYCLVFGYFFLPFFALLINKNKITVKRIVFISCWILLFQWSDMYFNILPRREPAADIILGYTVRQFSVTVWDVASIVGVGAICLWAYVRSMQKAEPIPIRDPRIQESLHHHE